MCPPVPAAVSVSPFECSSRPSSHTHSEQPCVLVSVYMCVKCVSDGGGWDVAGPEPSFNFSQVIFSPLEGLSVYSNVFMANVQKSFEWYNRSLALPTERLSVTDKNRDPPPNTCARTHLALTSLPNVFTNIF